MSSRDVPHRPHGAAAVLEAHTDELADLEVADLDATVEQVASAAYYNAGQYCTACRERVGRFALARRAIPA
jgi:hypothetical protein